MKTDVKINVHIISAVIQAVHDRGLLPDPSLRVPKCFRSVLDLYWKSECYSLKDCRISNTRPGWAYQNPGTQSTTVLSFDAFTEADFVCVVL